MLYEYSVQKDECNALAKFVFVYVYNLYTYAYMYRHVALMLTLYVKNSAYTYNVCIHICMYIYVQGGRVGDSESSELSFNHKQGVFQILHLSNWILHDTQIKHQYIHVAYVLGRCTWH